MSTITVTAVSALPKPEPEPVMRGARSADIAQAVSESGHTRGRDFCFGGTWASWKMYDIIEK